MINYLPADGLLSNRLYHLNDAVISGFTDDLDDQGTFNSGSIGSNNYKYDEIGQLIKDVTEQNYIEYDVSGKVTDVYLSSAKTYKKVKFDYDDNGQRVKKTTYIQTANPPTISQETWYVRDNGTLIAIYTRDNGTGTPTLQESYIYGVSRLGTINRGTTDEYTYELSDHLGNVRAVVKDNSGSLQLQSNYDYYPFGSLMPGRCNTPTYRFGYQGQFAEKDPETAWNSFELREWDGRIARWIKTDPYGQYHGPYMGMGNNPINRIDPDGGLDGNASARNRFFWYLVELVLVLIQKVPVVLIENYPVKGTKIQLIFKNSC